MDTSMDINITEEEDWDSVQEFPPQTGDVINGYRLEDKLKSSGNCVVYVCHQTTDQSKKFVVKIGIKNECKKLEAEMNNYNLLSGGSGVPEVFYTKKWTVKTEEWVIIDWAMIVMERLFSTRKTCSAYTKQTQTVDQLIPKAVQQIDLLELVHNKGLIHRGVKPDNFVMSSDGNKVFIIDFNSSITFSESELNYKISQNSSKKCLPKGLPLFHSRHYHNGMMASRRDDMESLAYCWVYLLKGCLPWSGVKKEPNKWSNYVKEIAIIKNKTTAEQLCEGLPKSFVKYFKMCLKLDINEIPNYKKMREIIANTSVDTNNNYNDFD